MVETKLKGGVRVLDSRGLGTTPGFGLGTTPGRS
jgi:hypothetical protein